MEYYGNKTWNNATDNKDKSVVPLREESLQKILPVLEQSGLNYYAYVKDGTAALAVNSSDTDKLKTVLGDQGQALRFQKSARPYTPPQKNIIGNVAYRYIPDKQYISLDRDTALKVAEQLEKANISFSGVIYVSGKATLTVGGADLARAEAVKQSVLDMRRQFTSEKKAEQIIGNTAYREIQNRRVLFTDVTPKQYAEMKDYLDSHCRYSGLIRNGKVMFTVDEADTVLFSQAIDTARDMQETIAEMRKKGFSAEQIESVSGLLERAAEKDDTFLISNNLDPRFTPEQFEELKEVMALALEESEMAIFNKDSAKNKVYALHKEFTHLAELADIYALHPYSDEQKAAIAEIYTDLFPVSLFEVVDETYPPAEMRELADIIQRFTSYNDVQRFLDNHQKRLEIAPENLEIYEALKAHKPVYLHKDNGGDGYEFHNERIEYYEGYGFAVIGDTDKDSDLVHQHFYTRNPEEVVFDFIQSGELAKDGYVIDGLTAPVREEQTAEITPETPELTDKEKAFLNGDLVKFLAKEPVAWDEIEDMGYRLFDKNYYIKYAPHDNSSFGNGLSDHALFDLARRFQNGEDIRAELAKALLGGQTFFRTNKGNEFTATHGEDSLTARFGNAEREISYAEIGGAMLDIIQKEHDDIVHDSTIEVLLDDVKGIDKETAEKVLTAFDNSRLHGWDTENNPVKINRIKRAIYEVLGDDEKTEAAFAAIAWCKYDVRFDKPVKEESSIHFGLLGNGITAYDVSRTDPETHDYPIVAHISPEGVITMREEVSAEDMERIRQQAQSARDEFMSSWNKLSTIAKYQRLLDNADITTLSNIHKEKLPTEETIAKYMPFVFFKEGERPEPEQEQNKAGFQIYQLPSGEQYHGIRFESLDTLTKEGVSLNISDYDLVYEGELPDFKGNATLESLFSRFNNDRPADFTGHSLSVSDVIVVNAEDKQTAYYCDSFGFVEMPDFFKEKEIAQEQTRPSVSDLSVGDVIRYEGKRYEVEKLDERGIDLKDLDSPDFGGVLLSTNEVLSFPGWREDMERKGFEILSKADTAVEDERKLVTLQDVVNQFFGTDCESAETENGTWKLAIADGDKVAELFYDGEAVCGIYNHGDKMEIEPYRELSTFPKLLQTAMLEHNPDKPVEIMEYQRTFDTPLDKAKYLINSFCEGEHGQTADFSDLHNVGIVYTTLTDDELPIQITADLVDFKITHEFNGEVFAVDSFDSIEDMIENGLSALDFSELISVPSEVLEGQTAPKQEKDEPVKLKTIVIDLNPQNTTRFERDEPTAEGSLDKAKNLINDFCVSEYSTEADFSNLTHIDLAYTTDEETMLPIQVYADLEQFRIVKEYDGNEAVTQNFGSLDEMLPALESLDFGDLVYLADEEKGITERTDEGIADHAPSDEPAVDDDTPLFADESVMEKIEADSKADDFSFKPFTNDDQGEQLTLFGDSEPLVSEQPKKRNAPKKEQYETGLFVGGVNRFAALHDELMRGTGFEHGKQTVTAFYKEHKPTNKEFADFLKQHYGVGGHSGDGEIGFVDHDSKGIVFTLETGEKFKFTWSDVAQQLSAMIDKGEYLPSESMTVDEPATTEKVVTADNIEIGDKFRYKGKEYTVDTMAGVYSDDIGVSHMETMSNGTSYAVTENVDRHTLIRDGEYLGNPDKRITPIVQPAETVSEPIPTEQPKQTANTDPTRFTALSDEATAFFTDYPPIPIPEMSPWGEVQECTIIAKGVFEVSTAGHGGIMIREDLAEQILSDEALQVGFTEDGFRCYEEDADAQIPLRELLDKGILDKEEYFSDKYHSTFEEKGEWFENAINGSIAAAHPDYWSAHEQAVGNSATAQEEQAEKAENFTITDEALGEGGQKAKFQANIAAIRTLKQIEAENRPATAEEKEILSRYVGWGGLAPAFEEQNSHWVSEHQELTELLTAEEYRSARASTLDAFYTSPLVIERQNGYKSVFK